METAASSPAEASGVRQARAAVTGVGMEEREQRAYNKRRGVLEVREIFYCFFRGVNE